MRAGLRKGTSSWVRGKDVLDIDELHKLLTEETVGTTFPLAILRSAEKQYVNIIPTRSGRGPDGERRGDDDNRGPEKVPKISLVRSTPPFLR